MTQEGHARHAGAGYLELALAGARNLARARARTSVTILLLGILLGTLGLVQEADAAARQNLDALRSRLQTTIEIRPVGSSGDGSMSGQLPESAAPAAQAVPHVVTVEAYLHVTQLDRSVPHEFAIVQGASPGARMRPVGELEPENVRLIAGRALTTEDAGRPVAVAGRVYAEERIGWRDGTELQGANVEVNGTLFRLVGVYETGNGFADNQAFLPLDALSETTGTHGFSRLYVQVDSVENVLDVQARLREVLPAADVIASNEAVSTTTRALAVTAAAARGGVVGFLAAGAILTALFMAVVVRERTREVATLKALGASISHVAALFVGEALALGIAGALVGLLAYGVALPMASRVLDLPLDSHALAVIIVVGAGVLFSTVGSLYPVIRAAHVPPMEALKAS